MKQHSFWFFIAGVLAFLGFGIANYVTDIQYDWSSYFLISSQFLMLAAAYLGVEELQRYFIEKEKKDNEPVS